MSLEMWTLPTSRSQELDRREDRPLGAADAEARRPERQGPAQQALRLGAAGARRLEALARLAEVDVVGRLGEEFQQAVGHHLGGVLARHRQHVLAVELGVDVALAQDGVDRLLDVVGRTFFDDQHGALALAEIDDLVGHQRVGDVQHQRRDLAFDFQAVEAAHQHVGDAALHDDAEVGAFAGQEFVQAMVDDEALGGRLAHLDLDLLVRVGRGRVRDAVVIVRGRLGETMAARDRRRLVVLGDEFTRDVAGADAQLHHHRRVGSLRKLEGLLRAAHDGRQRRPRVQQPHRGFERIGVGAFLDHRGALAVILADHDQRPADHARRGEVGERIGRHVGADDGFPGDAAAHRIVDRGAQQRGRRGFVGAGLEMNAKLVQEVLQFDQHVDQMRDRRALVAADIGHARLQDGLGDREDALAAKDLALAQSKRPHLLGEGAFRVGALGDGNLVGRLVEHGREYRDYRRDRRSRLGGPVPAARAFETSSRNGARMRSRTVVSRSRTDSASATASSVETASGRASRRRLP